MTDEDQLLESPLSSYALSQVCLKICFGEKQKVKSLKMGRERDRQTDKWTDKQTDNTDKLT